eukprot:TRINITY_DN1649_c0_g5_i1.p1 TRINITY_DN1649_c0_g5~~TRINITY_DN1649_c0_g5_i1.p1  ORF type:complete len:366 (+),score=102.82 TRINITY_DN1649_c0_g5_i1:109-1098(+)
MSSSAVHVIELSDQLGSLFAQSTAGHWSSYALPRLNIAFDCGTLFQANLASPVVAISHGHADHIGALAQHARVRGMTSSTRETYVMPRTCVEPFRRYYDALMELDTGDTLPKPARFTLVGVDPIAPRAADAGANIDSNNNKNNNNNDDVDDDDYDNENTADEDVFEQIPLPKKRLLRCFACEHRVDAVSYVLCEQRSSLRAELRGLSHEKIRDLVAAGERVSSAVVVPLFAYSGDSTLRSLLRHKTMLRATVLLVECTIWDDSVSADETTARGHIHLDQLSEHAEQFANEHVILTHRSARYSDGQCRDLLAASRFAKVLAEKKIKISIV